MKFKLLFLRKKNGKYNLLQFFFILHQISMFPRRKNKAKHKRYRVQVNNIPLCTYYGDRFANFHIKSFHYLDHSLGARCELNIKGTRNDFQSS